ncbi:hypothetical protein K466DRAFT_80661 [Polyporus arcularius HHB13444]|uniref:Uncharacterized protein n=1 Tax=Polyporus arcularius HHB13444 TaxID=1314778 RepID=A0A5C3PUY7_9APHY|nr:hypothetical protein K466DRAFT_80661 [Polyporus arcularius HHB13444]
MAHVPSRAKKAEKNNETLFPLFIKHLASSTLNEFSTTAEKLAVWLSVDRAYYPKARPYIVQMLETAHDNVCRQTGIPPPFTVTQAHPEIEQWTQPFLTLVRTVVSFYTRFPEETLQLRLRSIFKSISADVDALLSQQPVVKRSSTVESTSTTSTSPALPRGTIVSPNSVPGQTTTISQQQTGPSPTPISASIPLALSPFAPSSFAPSPSPSMLSPFAPPLSSPQFPASAPTAAAPASAAMQSQPSKPAKPKKRKYDLEDDDYIQADLNWFKDKQIVQPMPVPLAAEQSPTHGTVPMAPLPDSDSTPAPVVSAPAQPVSIASPCTTSVTDGQPAQKRPRSRSPSVPSQHAVDVKSRSPTVPVRQLVSPPPKPEHESRNASDTPSVSRSPTLFTPSTQRLLSPDRQKEALPSPLAKRATVKKKGKGKGPPGLKVLPCPPEPLQESRSESDTHAAASTSSKVSTHATHAATSQSASASPAMASPPPHTSSSSRAFTHTPAEGSDVLAATVEDSTTTTDHPSTPDVPEDSAPALVATTASHVLHDTTAIVASPEPMDLGSDEPEGPANSAKDDIAEETRPSIQQEQPDEDIVMRAQSLQPDEAPVEAASPRTGQGNITDTHGDEDVEMQRESVTPTVSPFMHKCIRLLGLTRGHSSYTPAQRPVELAFELTAEEVAQITRWRNRDTITGDLSTSMSISLLCYPSSQCTAVFARSTDEPSPADVVQCGHPAEWPTDSSVFAVLDSAGGSGPSHSFTLSPPFSQCESDRSVDLGTRGVSPGVNTLRLFQYRDQSDLAFAVILHHPTSAQLAELQRVRDQDRSWHEFLDRLGTFTLPAPTLVTPMLPKLNAVSSS